MLMSDNMGLLKKLEDKIVHRAHRKQFEDALETHNIKTIMALLRID